MSRVLLTKEAQRNLCLVAKDMLHLSSRGLAKYLNIPSSTFNNWSSCTRLLPEEIFVRLKELSGSNIDGELVSDNWGRIKGGKNNVSLHGKLFGTLESRRKGAKKGAIKRTKKFLIPHRSKYLAEFVGIMLGDGGISHNQVSITLGYSTDKEYVPYIIQLLKKVLDVIPSVHERLTENVVVIRISGKNLVTILLSLGLVQGNKVKQNFDIPLWILKEKGYIRACIRGMIDTDGCVHRKVRKEKNVLEYRSIGITFSSYSPPLQNSLMKLFNVLDFKIAISGTTIYLCGKEQINRYIKEIGFSNPKHLNRFNTFLKDYGWVKVASENCFNPLSKV